MTAKTRAEVRHRLMNLRPRSRHLSILRNLGVVDYVDAPKVNYLVDIIENHRGFYRNFEISNNSIDNNETIFFYSLAILFLFPYTVGNKRYIFSTEEDNK